KVRFIAASVSPNRAASPSSPGECAVSVGRQATTNTNAARTTRSATVPAGPTSSNSVRASADPNWTDPIPTTTRAVGGTASARRLVLVLERDVLERVHRAEVRPARVQCRPNLRLGQLRAALDAALLDDGLDSAAFLEVRHISPS